MLKVGITGGIGSGKSTLCSKLKDKGFKIHSSDEQVAKIYKNPDKKFFTYLRTIGLSKSVNKRKKLLSYLKRKKPDSYEKIIKQLSLRK